MGSLNQNPVPRKQPRAQLIERIQITPLTARLIEERIADLQARGVRTEYSRILAREFRVPEAFIDRVVAALMLRHRAEAATLRAGVIGALDAAREAAKDAWEDAA